jgi:phage terminase large subunit-like protein
LRTLPVAAGLDLAQKYDLAAFVLTFLELLPGPAEESPSSRPKATSRSSGRSRSISDCTSCPPSGCPKRRSSSASEQDRVPYDQWREAGLLKVTEGDVIDYDAILKEITGPLTARFPRLAAPRSATTRRSRPISRFGCGRGLSVRRDPPELQTHVGAGAHLEALIKGGRVNHDGHRILRWNIENVAVKRDDAGRIRPVKPKKAAKRIDGVVAAIMGTSRLVLQPAAASPQIHIMHDRPEDAGTPELRNDYSTEEDDPWNW